MSQNFKENLSIKKVDTKDKIFCQESYAQELYDMYCGMPVRVKDVKDGQFLRALDLRVSKTGEVKIMTDAGIDFSLDMKKERLYFDAIGFSDLDFKNMSALSENGWFKDMFQTKEEFIKVKGLPNDRRGSIYEAHLNKARNEFVAQITEQTAYYMAKVISKNRGGFFIKVQGIDAFLPGSLAAANKILDFETFIGKEIPVMVEDYLRQSDTFIFSYKKYLEKILPSRLAEIEKFSILEGIITGSSKYGIFVEFQDIFTGLLHTSEMNFETFEKFEHKEIVPGTSIKVWVKDIRDNKLILTELDPNDKFEAFSSFKNKSEGTVRSMKVISVKTFGAFFEVEDSRVGLLPVREMKKLNRRIEVGEVYELCISKIDAENEKIYLTALTERVTG